MDSIAGMKRTHTCNDLGPANLIYIERLLDHMTADQKKKIAEAASKLEKLAMDKKDRNGKVSENLARRRPWA